MTTVKNSIATTKSYNALPGTKMGIVSIDYLEKLTQVAREHKIPLIKITSAQRFAIGGHSPEETATIWQKLGQASGPVKPVGIHYIQACPGVRWCKYGQQDSLALGEKIEAALIALPLPAKTKVGISGCPMNCCEGFVRDIGVFGKKNGWTLVFGGNGGGLPRIGNIIGTDLTDTQVIELARSCLDFYRQNARKKERTARFMERTAIENFLAAVRPQQ